VDHLKVFIVDGYEPVRQRLAARLADWGIEVVGHTGDSREAVRLTRALAPDVVLVDIRSMANNGAPAMCALLAKALPGTSIVILTSYIDDEVLTLGTEAGVTAYLLKTIGSRDLARDLKDIVVRQRNAEVQEGRWGHDPL